MDEIADQEAGAAIPTVAASTSAPWARAKPISSFTVAGRERGDELGVFPELSLAEAREKHAELRKRVKVDKADPIAQKRAAKTASRSTPGSRSGSYWCNSLILSRLAEAALAAGNSASAGAALQEAFAFVEQSGEQSGSPTCIGSMATSRSSGQSQTGAGTCSSKAIDIARSQESTHARIARRDRSRRTVGSETVRQRCPRFVGADPRAGRGRRDHEGRPQRPRAAGGIGRQFEALSARQPSIGSESNAASQHKSFW